MAQVAACATDAARAVRARYAYFPHAQQPELLSRPVRRLCPPRHNIPRLYRLLEQRECPPLLSCRCLQRTLLLSFTGIVDRRQLFVVHTSAIPP